ncbi:MAG TPA: insulinase family protein [Caulobacteraceae bacterium]
MSRSSILAATALAACLVAGQALAEAAPRWAQTASDVAADPAVRFGVLPNGLRYAVMKNATPGGQTSLRLRIGSGSLEESDAEQGLAHVLEHMAFKGSTHVPAGEMLKILERDGLAFGPDTNAETGWTQTVFMLDLPKSDKALIDTGLMLMRETGGELLIEPSALATERGVVLSEERLRDTPDYRAAKAQLDLLAHDQLATRRFPIGQVEVVQNAPASLVRTFYRANYRPDRATLIAVGDFDPATVEAAIKARFSDWKPVGPATAEPDLGQVEKRGLTVKVVQLPGAQTLTYIAWARPYDDAADTAAKRRHDTVENLALAVLNRRLSRLALGANPPFISADGAFQNLLHSDKVAIVEASSADGAWRPALGAIEQEVRRLVTFGVGKGEVAREIAQQRAGLVNAEAGASTRPTPELANGLVESVDNDQVFTAPVEDLAVYDAAVKDITPAEVDAAARAIFAGAGPLVELQGPTRVAEADVAKAYAASSAVPVVAPTVQGALVWPYDDFGKPGVVKERHDIADLGAVTVRFANGVGLTVKSTNFRKDQILVAVDVGHGRQDLPSDRPDAAWAASALPEGGFRAMSFDDSQTVLAGRIYGAGFSVNDNAFQLQGSTRPRDLATQMQVLAAYVAAPGFRPEAFERLRAAYQSELPQLAATPGGVVRRDFEALIHAGDPRWATPSEAELTAAKPEALRGLLQGPFAQGPIEITIVGDVGVDEAIAQVAATFGALPPRPASARPADAETRFPAPTPSPVTLTDSGRPDQAMAIIAWPLTDFYKSTARSRAALMAGEVLQNRVVDKVRIAQGATYSPETQVSLSETFPDYGLAYTAVEMPPRKIPTFFADIAAITADMREHGVSEDELARARNPRLAAIRKAQLTNEYWLVRLEGIIGDPRRLEIIRTTLPDYEKVTVGDVQAAARAWFVDAKAWKLVVKAAP